MDHEVIDLQFANARQGRDTDRRFSEYVVFSCGNGLHRLAAAFEIVTPKYGKRMYQSTSHDDMKVSSLCPAYSATRLTLLSPGFTRFVMRSRATSTVQGPSTAAVQRPVCHLSLQHLMVPRLPMCLPDWAWAFRHPPGTIPSDQPKLCPLTQAGLKLSNDEHPSRMPSDKVGQLWG